MSSETEPPHISMKAAVKLAGWKPSKNQTRNDLLVYGGWLTSRWEWSRDTDVSLDQAIANSRRLGEDIRIVGNPKPGDRKKAKGRKETRPFAEPTEAEARPVRPSLPIVSELPPQEGGQQAQEETETNEISVPLGPPRVASGGPMLAYAPPPSVEPSRENALPASPEGSHLLLARFLVASALCSVALFLGYFGLAGSIYVYVLLMADAFFILATSILALRARRSWGGTGRNSAVKASDVATGS